MYALVATQLDITFVVSTLLEFLENLGEAHWQAVKQVFHYLAGTCNVVLTYGGEWEDLHGYTNTDGASQDHHQAISGYAFIMDSGAISWSLQKQKLVTLSTVEVEYVVAMHAAKECIWLHRLAGDILPPLPESTTLHCDNQAALKLAQDNNYHTQMKHIDIWYHFIQDVVKQGTSSYSTAL